MPALPSPSTRYDPHSVQWLRSDLRNIKPDSPNFKLPKFTCCFYLHSTQKPLAASRSESSSPSGKLSSVCKFANSRECYFESGSAGSIWSSTSERKRSSDDLGADILSSKRERGVLDHEGCKLRVVASSRCKSASLLASDVIGTIDFNEDGNFFATGGIARKIRICSYEKMVSVDEGKRESSDEDSDISDEGGEKRRTSSRRRRYPRVRDHEDAAAGEICTPGKLSSLKWRPDGSEVIGCGDYDGVVMEWNIEHRHTVSEKYEHSGQRVWSLDYSKVTPTLSASSSADGTVRVWSRGVDQSVSVLRPGSGNSICAVEFSPVADHFIAVASADSNVYVYDLRMWESPLLVLGGHDRAVSYVRFLGKDKLVSASIDSTLKLWDISAPLRDFEANDGRLLVKTAFGQCVTHPVRTFAAHTNVRHFVGLSIHRGAGILACGSETNEVFLYRNSCALPLNNQKFPGTWSGCYVGPGHGNPYIGAVCWRERDDKSSLVAANSEGIVQVLEVSHTGGTLVCNYDKPWSDPTCL